jgi:hypothetical protein
MGLETYVSCSVGLVFHVTIEFFMNFPDNMQLLVI